MTAASEEEAMRDIFEDLQLEPGITRDDVELAGCVIGRMVEWRRNADAGMVVVGSHWDTVSTWDAEEGDYHWEDIVVEAWSHPERLAEARRMRTWWDRAAQAGFADWA